MDGPLGAPWEATLLKAIYGIGTALLTLACCLHASEPALAQIAPTNAATVSGSASDPAGKPVAGATVLLSGSKISKTLTDGHGIFVFVDVPFGNYRITITSALGTVTQTIAVQGDINVAIAYKPVIGGLKTIANVSSSANASFNVTSASVTQVSPVSKALQGQTSWRPILEEIPGVARGGVGNGGGSWSASPDSPMVPVQLSINGALPYETAILLDNMPLISGSISSNTSGGAGTDLGLYPLNGFGAADVVRGPGAASPSIVDSIGGSFVLHSPGGVRENHGTYSFSTDPYGGIVANAIQAVRLQKLSITAAYGVNDSPGPINGPVIPAITLFSPATINGQPFQCTGLCPASPLHSTKFASASGAYYGFTNGLLTCCYQDSTSWSQHSGSIGLNYEITPSVSARFFYAGQSSQQAQPSPAFTVDFFAPHQYAGSLPTGQHVLTGDGAYLGPYLMNQAVSLFEESLSASIGSGFLQLKALQNTSFSKNTLNSTASFTQHLYGSGTVGGVPTVFNGGIYHVTYSTFDDDVAQQNYNRDMLISYATPLSENVRAGASYVTSYYNNPSQTQQAFAGSVSPPSIVPSAVSQTTHEYRVFVGGAPSSKTSLDLSQYFVGAVYHIQNPSDASGNTFVGRSYSYSAPRLGFVWRPTGAVAIRAAAGGGFAEAPLSYLVGANGAITPGAGSFSQTLTNIDLQPETSFGFDIGADVRLKPQNTVISFDIYRTNLYGQFYNSTSLGGTYHGLPLYVTKFGNLGESRYEGILFDLRHDVTHGVYGRFSGGLTRGYVVSVPPGFYNGIDYPPPKYKPTPCTNCANLPVVPGINFNGTYTGVSVPYSQALGTLGYRWKPQTYVDLVGTYYGNNNSYLRPAFVELDAHASYQVTKVWSLLLTFRNMTGVYDGSYQVYAPGNILGVPAVSGLPYPEYGEMYGPRALIVTTQVSI